MAEPASTMVGGIELAKLLLEEAEKQGLLEKLRLLFKQKPRVLLLGATGTGKSNFLLSLILDRPDAIPREMRTKFSKARTLLLKRSPFRFVDTPGDLPLKDARVQAIREAMSAKGGIAGVINIVSYGYHEYDIDKKDVFLSDGTVNPDYLEKHRKFEIEQLTEWTTLLGSPDTTGWLITLVTKADLWWNNRTAVKAYYTGGPYHHALGDAKTLKPRVLFYSSVFSKFYGEAPMSGYFDEGNREELRKQFIEGLLAALLQHKV